MIFTDTPKTQLINWWVYGVEATIVASQMDIESIIETIELLNRVKLEVRLQGWALAC